MSGLFYSPSARGFFLAELHGSAMPADVLPLSEEEYAALLAAQARGSEIRPAADGRPEAIAPAPAPPPPPIRQIAPLAFRRRLPTARRVAITQAAAAAQAEGDSSLQTWLDDLAAAKVVDLDDPELLAGVAAMQAAGLIDAAEAALLTADGTPDEVG